MVISSLTFYCQINSDSDKTATMALTVNHHRWETKPPIEHSRRLHVRCWNISLEKPNQPHQRRTDSTVVMEAFWTRTITT